MSMLYVLKPQKDRVLRPISRTLLTAGVTPNMVTVFGLLMCVIAGILAMYGHLYSGVLLFMAGAVLDAVDGSLARESGLCTEFGRYFDSICDRLSEMALVVGAVIGGASSYAFAVAVGSIMLLASRIYNHRKGANSNAAMFGRPERLALLIAGLLSPAPYNMILFMVAGVLCLVSAAQAMASGYRGKKSTSIGRATLNR